MNDYYLAIDIGASSVKIILGYLLDDKLHIEEIYRFENKIINKDNHLFWDLNNLIDQIIIGLKICNKINKIPKYVGIDTFGVDYCLLDDENCQCLDVYSYRDNRTKEPFNEIHKKINRIDYFKMTGIQPQSYNTIYQLYHDKMNHKLTRNVKVVMLSSYLAYYFTGILYNEATIFSTTGLLDIDSKNINEKLLNILSLTKENFPNIVKPGSIVGKFKEDISKEIGFRPTLIAVCQHDTASAVVASRANNDTLYLSSGTWSLIGATLSNYSIEKSTYELGFTNELGFNCEYRILKNITGLWMIQQVKKENHPLVSIEKIIELAEKNNTYNDVIDVNDKSFLNPSSMTKAIENYLKRNNMRPCDNIGELYYLVYNSLAKSYFNAIKEIEKITNKKYETLNIVGGGSQNRLLNELTKKHINKKIILGPVEATAIGNIIVQMVANRKISYEMKNELLESLKGEKK
ncbi:MAG: rhamnulokinase [Acholeplasmataceae bacterium]|nr:rhamnulokinase [Acholeplasmataceae bacterium]